MIQDLQAGICKTLPPENVGDMYDASGESIVGQQLFSLTKQVVDSIFDDVAHTRSVEFARGILPSSLVDLYVQKAMWEEIQPVIKKLCRARWIKENGYDLPAELAQISVSRSLVKEMLILHWPDREIALHLNSAGYLELAKKVYRVLFKPFVQKVKNKRAGLEAGTSPRQKGVEGECADTLVVHYVEGIDRSRRSELNWFPKSGISPEHILLYFNSPDNNTDKPVPESVLAQIEQDGMGWVTFSEGYLERGLADDKHHFCGDNTLAEHLVQASSGWPSGLSLAEKLGFEIARDLLGKVSYWQSFFRRSNARAHFTPGEGQTAHIAQTIACTMEGNALTIGRQRSELGLVGPSFGFYPFDVYFSWSARCKLPLQETFSQTGCAVIIGYPNDGSFERNRAVGRDLRKQLEERGAQFCVALYDNVHSIESQFSSDAMEKYYRAFLEWVLEDESFGLLIKSKKPHVLAALPDVQDLLARAVATGRCVRLPNERGRLPSEVSGGADMVVGIGISSAVAEAVIAGARGVHYDITRLYSYDYYDWGRDRLIFDDLQRLLNSLKEYKDNPQLHSGLGDWSEYIDLLDPFRDGGAEERMGSYLRWCLQSFQDGLGREQVVREANRRYRERWGDDKVIEFEDLAQAPMPPSYCAVKR